VYDSDSYEAYANEKLLTKALSNILDNAIKFTKSGGVTLKAFHEARNEVDFLWFEIIDTGIGIDSNDHEIIFKEFKQLSEGMDRGYEGTGIGLTIAKRMIEYLNGVISVKSEVGKGSTFSILIPAVKGERVSSSDNQNGSIEEIKSKPKAKILSVEDNFENRTIIRKYLNELFFVDDAVNALQAIQLAKEVKYDLILMDISLEGAIDGRTAAKEIRKIEGYDAAPIIAITGYALFADKDQFLSEGFNGYLAKPYRKNQLLEVINEYLK